MSEKTLIARVHPDSDDPATLIVSSPVVGRIDGELRTGLFLNPFERIASMIVLNRRFVVRLPRDVAGGIVEVFVPDAVTPVAYGDPIIRIDPRAGAGGDASPGSGSRERRSDSIGTEGITIKAPSEGFFYRRPTPDSPAYIEVGSKVEEGTVLGLVEVMKCFNPITYGGVGLPSRGEVLRILVEDGSEVQFGQPLFDIRPIA